MANDASTLLFCLDATTSDVTAQGATDGLADGSESTCYTVDAAGDVTLTSISLTVSGMALTFVAG